jgi:ParB family chromosome partitioning protein
LGLSPAAQDALREERVTEGHARAILSLKDYPKQQEELLLLIQKNGWSVRQAEQFATATKRGATTTRQAAKSTGNETTQTKAIGEALGTEVTIRRMAKGGRLVISFKSDDDLKRLYKLLQKLNKQ